MSKVTETVTIQFFCKTIRLKKRPTIDSSIKEKDYIIGVTRFWKTPYCNNKWLIEGLEVIPPKRKLGVGKSIVKHGISLLHELTDENIFVNISNKNIPSIKLHESLGFKKISNGSINSLGDYRENIDQYLIVLKR